MTSTWGKYAQGAEGWSDEAYADARTYLARRAELVRTLGPPLVPGDTVLDLACGDGGLSDFLPQPSYRGVDASPEMVEAAPRRGRDVVQADLNGDEPPGQGPATALFRPIHYPRARRALLT